MGFLMCEFSKIRKTYKLHLNVYLKIIKSDIQLLVIKHV